MENNKALINTHGTKSKPKVPSIQNFIQKDLEYSNPSLIRSLLTLDIEEKEIRKTIGGNSNQVILEFQKKKLSQILENKQILRENLENGKLFYKNYLDLLKDLINTNSRVFTEAKKKGENDFLSM